MKKLSNIRELFTRAANHRGIGREAVAAFICHKYRDLAPGLIGPEVLNYSHPKHYHRQILTIAVNNSAWAQEIHIHKITLIDALNQAVKPHEIKEIRVLISKDENILT